MTDIDKKIEENIGLVYFVIDKFFPQYKGDEDVIQIGTIALWKAIMNYRKEKKIKFSTFATNVIKNAIANEWKRREKRMVGMINSTNHTYSLDYPLHNQDGEQDAVFVDTLESNEEMLILEGLEKFKESLDERDKIIIYNKSRGLGINEIAELMGLTRTTVGKRWKRIRERMVRDCFTSL